MDGDDVADLFSAFGPVVVRRMFGGGGLYADGLMFAIEAGGGLYLKADEAFAGDLAARGSFPFSYEAKGAVRTMKGFWSVPEAALDDAEDLAALARRSLALARAAKAAKKSLANTSRVAKAHPAPGRKGAPKPKPRERP